MEILNGVIKKSLIIIVPAAIATAFLEWEKFPLGILAGAGFGILNLRGLVRSVHGFIGAEGLTFKIIFMSMTRLFLLFAAISILLWLKIVNVFGLLSGFTVVFVLVLLEGLKTAKRSR
jgi:hypothetical protein